MPTERLVLADSAPGIVAALEGTLGILQRSDPLREVVVLTPPGPTAGTLRRVLPLANSGRGVASVRFTTAVDRALDVAGHEVRRQPPVTPQLLASAIRVHLTGSACPAPLVSVRDHRSTLDALVEVAERLRTLDLAPDADSVVAALAGSSSTRRAVIDVAVSSRRALVAAGYRDEASVLAAALRRLRAATAPDDSVPPLIVVMAEPFHPAHVPFVAALVASSPEAVVVAARPESGDATLADQVARVVGQAVPARQDPVGTPASITSCPDQDEEVRHVVRSIVERATGAAPAPLHRIVVLHPPGDGYERRLGDELQRAEIEWTGRAPGTIAGSVAGQVVRALLDAVARPDRVQVFRLLDVAPRWTSWSGPRRPVAAWRQLCRELGVVRRDEWDEMPGRLERRQQRGGTPARPPWAVERDERELRLLSQLRDLVREIERTGAAIAAARSWAMATGALGAQLTRHIGDRAWRERHWGALPEWQRRAADQVQALLAGLSALDEADLGAPFSPSDVAPVVRGLLDASLGRQGEPTVGVRVLSLTHSVLLDADVVYVVGLNDGVLPQAPHEDLIVRRDLPEAASDWVEAPDWSVQRTRRAWVSVLDGAAEVHATWARGDLRRGGERYPSQWIAASEAEPAVRWHHSSHAAGLWTGPALSVGELVHAEGESAAQRYESLRLRVRSVRSRQQLHATDVDGVVGPQPVCHPTSRIQSVSRFETLASCGLAFFLRHILGVDDLPDPAEITTIEGRDRGTLVHAAMEGLVRHWLALGPDRPEWSSFARSSLALHVVDGLVDGEADRLRRENRLGHETAWRLERRLLVDAIAATLADEAEDRVEPLAVEHEFGFTESSPALTLPTPVGTVEVRGKIDRIDRVGATARVTDFKSSGSQSPKSSAPRAGDPTLGGTKLQLPLYATVAARDFGSDHRAARYVYLHQAQASVVGLPPEAFDVYLADIDRLAARMANGEFYPGVANERFGCDACSPDGLGLEAIGIRAARWLPVAAADEPADL